MTIPDAGKDSEKLSFPYKACGDVKWKIGSFFKKKKQQKSENETYTYNTAILPLRFIPDK